MPVVETTILSKLLDVLIVIMTGGIVYLFRKAHRHDELIAAHNTEIQLCHQRDEQRALQRREDRRLRDEQRKEIIDKINAHHKLVMGKLEEIRKDHD